MDVIAQAQSGTGKTATFSISILQQIDTNLRECQVPPVQIYTRISRYKAVLRIQNGYPGSEFFSIPEPIFFPSWIRVK
jgi:hypothetical protein